MESSELMFLFEITVDEVKSFSNAKNHKIRVRFGDVFTLQLKDPNQVVAEAMVTPRIGRRSRRPFKIRNGRVLSPNNLESSQIAVVVSDIESLERSMLNYPIELTHYSKDEPFVLGVVEIPWTMHHIEYLKNIIDDSDQPPVVLKGTYKTYDEYTSKRVAVITLTISLSQIIDNFAMKTKIISKTGVQNDNLIADIDNDFSIGTIRTIYSGGKLDSRKKHKNDKNNLTTQNKNVNVLMKPKNFDKEIDPNITQECNMITIETDNITEVRNTEEYSQNVTKDFNNISDTKMNQKYEIIKSETYDISHDYDITKLIHQGSSSTCKNIENTSAVNLTRSRSQHMIDKTDLLSIQPISKNSKCWSNTAIEVKERLDTLNYIFGNTDGPFGNRVYCVEYFTVETDQGAGVTNPGKSSPDDSPPKTPEATSTKTHTETHSRTPDKTHTRSPSGSPPKTPEKSSDPEIPKSKKVNIKPNNYSLNICDDKCIFGGPTNPCFKNVCEIDLPETKLVNVTKCTHSSCNYRTQPASLTDPFRDEIPILVDFGKSQTTKDCCAKEVEQIEVFSGMNANFVQDPCSCTCECTFGFIAKTTYCNICGGFEVPGDEMKSTRGGAPFPCPIYHGWQKGKKGLSKKSSATGDDKSVKSKRSVESDKESKKAKKHRRWRDPRFKFNYGYKGIPPKIGHSQCAFPCTGDLFPVPKHMGWLWTADNIPGLKAIANGWKPGAISKRLLHKLNQAKQNTSTVSNKKPLKKVKKRENDDKPALIVAKRNGEYIVEMQVYDKTNDPENPELCKPLIYKIASPNREERMRLRALKTQRMIEKARQEVMATDRYNPDACEQICGKSYKMAIGMIPYDSYGQAMDDCICPEDMIESNDPTSTAEDYLSEEDSSDYSSLDLDWEIHFTPPNVTRKEV